MYHAPVLCVTTDVKTNQYKSKLIIKCLNPQAQTSSERTKTEILIQLSTGKDSFGLISTKFIVILKYFDECLAWSTYHFR